MHGLRTYFVHEAAEDRAPRPSRQPQQHDVAARAPLRLHEVVEELRPGLLLHAHVPAVSCDLLNRSEIQAQSTPLQRSRAMSILWCVRVFSSLTRSPGRRVEDHRIPAGG
ncbi:Os02g0688000 [Oryza sativa Japonica Group]|uniref:Os02g0688000 protein n=1 Tax=Oryza sativa subsp. japonica TaxID=39947 RepID=A0A0P0VN53_ORYSJ|nr:Os02g0688000 [Oryza sativa Japonica Group]